MSLFTSIASAEHSTMAWIEKELTALEGAEPKIEKVVDAGVSYIGPVLEIALDALGQTAAATEVGAIVSKAQTDLTAVNALITDFGPTPTAASVLASVKTNLSTILTDANVTNATSVAAVTKAVNEVGVLGSAISTAATAISAAATTTAA